MCREWPHMVKHDTGGEVSCRTGSARGHGETTQPAAALDRAPPALSLPAMLSTAGHDYFGPASVADELGSDSSAVIGSGELFRFAGQGRGSSDGVGFQKLRLVDVDAPKGRSPVGDRGSPFTFSPENWGSRSRIAAFMAAGV
ncbi:Cdc48-Ufd1-Npl4 complex component Ufd1 [Striga asiatica]|uniref:Cdc48-Ufd1-Npl4 complex component Ufd1 n=1 Tax=Striga asiatica TaxID=4170 RepID=A0A5A7PJT1_STRAF|nr:Cdc48-Ufd1-Npl4 complex component Ufd1 [Striga asiatica]